LTMHDSDLLVQEVLEAGARGYILKDDADRNLLAAVDALRRHKPFLSSRVSDVASKTGLPVGGGQVRERSYRNRLTPREREILQLLAEGKTNKEVAGLLGISVKTAETHRANIMLKLDFHSVTDLVRYAVRNKIIQG
jgi:DNA-binding NarL/FixJ family response regulator